MRWAEKEFSVSFSLGDIPKLLSIKTRYFFGGWVFGALLIFLPDDIKQRMAITIPESVKPWLGFSTLALFVLWIVLVAMKIISYFGDKIKNSQNKAKIIEQLRTLSDNEREIFILCLARNQQTIHRKIDDSSIHSLVSKRLLVRASGVGNILSWPCTIPNFVWEHLKKNEHELFPELFDENKMKRIYEKIKYGWMAD